MTTREISIIINNDARWKLAVTEKLADGSVERLDLHQLQALQVDLQVGIDSLTNVDAAQRLMLGTLYYSRLGGKPTYCVLTSIDKESGALLGYETDNQGNPTNGTAPRSIYPAASLHEAKHQPVLKPTQPIPRDSREYADLSFRLNAMNRSRLEDVASDFDVEFSKHTSADELRRMILDVAAAGSGVPTTA